MNALEPTSPEFGDEMILSNQREILERLEDVIDHHTEIGATSDLPQLAHDEIVRLKDRLDAIFAAGAYCSADESMHGHWCECFGGLNGMERFAIYESWMGGQARSRAGSDG